MSLVVVSRWQGAGGGGGGGGGAEVEMWLIFLTILLKLERKSLAHGTPAIWVSFGGILTCRCSTEAVDSQPRAVAMYCMIRNSKWFFKNQTSCECECGPT